MTALRANLSTTANATAYSNKCYRAGKRCRICNGKEYSTGPQSTYNPNIATATVPVTYTTIHVASVSSQGYCYSGTATSNTYLSLEPQQNLYCSFVPKLLLSQA
jgi:hypothetical protein